MSRDEIIAMAREAGFTANCGHTDRDGTHHPAINALSASVPVQWLERFAALVAAKERWSCAQVLAMVREPLTRQQLREAFYNDTACTLGGDVDFAEKVCRVVEKAHGIKQGGQHGTE